MPRIPSTQYKTQGLLRTDRTLKKRAPVKYHQTGHPCHVQVLGGKCDLVSRLGYPANPAADPDCSWICREEQLDLQGRATAQGHLL